MSTTRFLGVGLSLIGLAACNPFRQQAAVELSTGDASLNSRWHANLASPATLAGVVQMSGSASMAPAPGGGTIVTLDLANASPGGKHPWEARLGQCGTQTQMDGGVFGMRDAYEPLEVGSNGQATGTATVQVETPEAGRYFVVVHASDANSSTVVACGNLAAPTR
jgi:hypothetical protein